MGQHHYAGFILLRIDSTAVGSTGGHQQSRASIPMCGLGVCIDVMGQYSCRGPGVCIGTMNYHPCGFFGVRIGTMDHACSEPWGMH